jgi:hypothetical protein
LPLVGHELRRRHGELPFTAAADQVKWFVKGANTKLRKRLRAATAALDAGDPFPAETPVPRDAFINREPSRPEGVEVVVAVAIQNGPRPVLTRLTSRDGGCCRSLVIER